MKIVITLDNVFFVLVKILLRITRMAPFIGANVSFGVMFLLLGFWILDIFGKEAPGGVVTAIFWIIGGAIIFATLWKGRDPTFVEQFISEYHARYGTPWYAPSRRILRILTAIFTLLALIFAPGFLLPLAFLFNVSTSYALGICLSEYEKKHESQGGTG